MGKRLAPGLFEEVSTPSDAQNTYLSPAYGATAHNASLPSMGAHLGKMELQKLTDEISAVKAKVRSFENQMDVIKNQVGNVLTTVDQRFDRLSQALARLEKSLHTSDRNTADKIQAFREKLQSSSLEEAKVEGLIERQTILIRNFENRLSSMQQQLNEKELLIMRYAEALQNAQRQKK